MNEQLPPWLSIPRKTSMTCIPRENDDDFALLVRHLLTHRGRHWLLNNKLSFIRRMSSLPVVPLVVLGGGISGLSCVYYLSKLPQHVLGDRKILLIEGNQETGGLIKSCRFSDGVIHELGPRSIRSSGFTGINTLNLVSCKHSK